MTFDQQQRRGAGVRRVAVQIVIPGGHVFFGSLVYYPARTLPQRY